MKIAVIKYNAGNIRSVSFALERLNVDFSITDSPEEIIAADKVIHENAGIALVALRLGCVGHAPGVADILDE